MSHHWEAELSGVGAFDGKRIALPKGGKLQDHFPIEVIEIPVVQGEIPPDFIDDYVEGEGDLAPMPTYRVARFHLSHRRDDDVFVYREQRD